MRNDTEGETPNPEMEIVSDLLPELIEEHQNHAASKESISWILNLLGHYRPGDVHDDGYGVLLLKLNQHIKGLNYIRKGTSFIRFTPSDCKII